MRILVTGARGFLGGCVAREAARRCPAASLFLLNRPPARPDERVESCPPVRGAEEVVCDLENAERTSGAIRRIRPDWVFHMAGLSKHAPWPELWRAHVASTMHLLDAIAELPSPRRTRVVIAGSSGEYGEPSSRLDAPPYKVAESALARPLNPYGASKLCESLCGLSYVRRGIETIVARIFNVIGPGSPDHLALGAFARQIAEIESGKKPPKLFVGNLKPRRDYVDVRDVAAALVGLAREGKAGEIYNVCSGRAHSMAELLDRLLSFSSCRIRIAADPARYRPVEAGGIAGSFQKLRSLTGWTPKIPLNRSLADTLDWYREKALAPCLRRPADKPSGRRDEGGSCREGGVR